MSFLLAKEYDVDVEDIKPLVKEVFQPATNGFPEIKFQVLEKNKYGDRELKVKPLVNSLMKLKIIIIIYLLHLLHTRTLTKNNQ